MKIFTKIIVLIAALALPSAQGVESDEYLLNAYIKDQAVKNLETFLPRGDFIVQTTVKIKAAEKDESISLPFGGSVVHLSDLQDFKSLPFSDLLKRIQSIKIQVSLDKSVAEGVKLAIQTSLTSSFYLDSNRGDKVDFQLLPEGWKEVWHPSTPQVASPAKDKPDYTLEYTLAAIAALFLMVFFLCFQRLQKSISSAVLEASQARETEEMPKMDLTRNALASEESGRLSKDLAGQGTTNSISNMDLSLLKAFVVDSSFVEKYQSVTRELLNGILPYELSCSLEDSLPPYFLLENEAPALGENQIKQILFKYLSEYRKFSKSPLFGAFLQLEPSGMIRAFIQLETVERLLVLQNTGPLFRERLIEELTPKERLHLFNHVGTAVSDQAVETGLSQINGKLAKNFKPTSGLSQRSFAQLGKAMLNPFTFEEDEAFYTETRGNLKVKYSSVLEAFEILEKSDWASLDLNMIALSYGGYSSSVKEQLESVFEGKRKEWLKSLFARMSNQAAPAFSSPECLNSRSKLMRIISERKLSVTIAA